MKKISILLFSVMLLANTSFSTPEETRKSATCFVVGATTMLVLMAVSASVFYFILGGDEFLNGSYDSCPELIPNNTTVDNNCTDFSGVDPSDFRASYDLLSQLICLANELRSTIGGNTDPAAINLTWDENNVVSIIESLVENGYGITRRMSEAWVANSTCPR